MALCKRTSREEAWTLAQQLVLKELLRNGRWDEALLGTMVQLDIPSVLSRQLLKLGRDSRPIEAHRHLFGLI